MFRYDDLLTGISFLSSRNFKDAFFCSHTSLYRNFTEGEGRKVVEAPDDGLILPPLAPSNVGQVLGRGGPGQFQGDGFSGATHGGQLSRAVIEMKPFDDFFLPFHLLIKDQLDFVFPAADEGGAQDIRWRYRGLRFDPIVVLVHQGKQLPGHRRIAVRQEVATTTRPDAEGRKNAHVGELLGQLPLPLPQAVALDRPAAACPRPNLVNVVVFDIRIVLLPGCRHADEVILIIHPSEGAGRS